MNTPSADPSPRSSRAILLGAAGVMLAGGLVFAAFPSPSDAASPVLGARSSVALGPATPAAFPLADAGDTAHIGDQVRQRLGDLEACYQSRLEEQPGVSGEILIHWRVEADGRVSEQCITDDSTGDQGLSGCVNALVAEAPFQPPRNGALEVQYPFAFNG